MTRSPISLRVEGAISIITIDDGKTNVVGQPMSQGLGAALDDIDHRQGTVVIEGREGLSSAGFDSHVVPSDDPEAARRMLISGVHVALKAFDFSRPIVAAGTGHAVATGGLDGRIGRADWTGGLAPRGTSAMGSTRCATVWRCPSLRSSDRGFGSIPCATKRRRFDRACFRQKRRVETGFLDIVTAPDRLHEAAYQKAAEPATPPNPPYAVPKQRDRAVTKNYVLDSLEGDLDALQFS